MIADLLLERRDHDGNWHLAEHVTTPRPSCLDKLRARRGHKTVAAGQYNTRSKLYANVYKHPRSERWYFRFERLGETHRQTGYATEHEAAAAYNEYVVFHGIRRALLEVGDE